jgi:Fe2+ or Zn2+ uptake regulation protein
METLTVDLEQALTDLLRSRGQRSTPQRLAVARVLTDLATHVTAEDVHAEVVRRVPGVSLPTVYATLGLLEELGHVQRVSTQGGKAVYDPRTDHHHHLVCRTCGAIADVDAPLDERDALAAARAVGFEPDQAELVLRGRCARCSASAQNAGAPAS